MVSFLSIIDLGEKNFVESINTLFVPLPTWYSAVWIAHAYLFINKVSVLIVTPLNCLSVCSSNFCTCGNMLVLAYYAIPLIIVTWHLPSDTCLWLYWRILSYWFSSIFSLSLFYDYFIKWNISQYKILDAKLYPFQMFLPLFIKAEEAIET